jgi:hypothetical protein
MTKGFSVRFGQGIFPPRCHFDRSGEISRPNSTDRIVDGDLSAQSFNSAEQSDCHNDMFSRSR